MDNKCNGSKKVGHADNDELLQYFILFESCKHIDCSRLFENNPLWEAGGAVGPTIGMAVQRSCRVGTIATITQEAH